MVADAVVVVAVEGVCLSGAEGAGAEVCQGAVCHIGAVGALGEVCHIGVVVHLVVFLIDAERREGLVGGCPGVQHNNRPQQYQMKPLRCQLLKR